MEGKKNKKLIGAIVLLTIFYLTGLFGLTNDHTVALFMQLVPFNILLSVAILCWFHSPWNGKAFFSMAVIVFAGFIIEYAGVNTGMVFGNYTYGSSFGWKAGNTPVIIGMNWLLLVYITHVTVRQIGIRKPWIELTAAALMTALDYLIEPVAMQYDFWHWEKGHIPVQNFVAWFYVSFAMHLFFNRVKPVGENRMAIPLFILQILFFTVLNIWR